MQGIVVQPTGALLAQNMVQQPTEQFAMPPGQQQKCPTQSSAHNSLPSEVYSLDLESHTAIVMCTCSHADKQSLCCRGLT